MNIADAKPGELWRVYGEYGRWATWLILDGEELETAHGLGYEGSCAVLLELGDFTDDFYASQEDDPFSCLTELTHPIFTRPTETWKRIK